MAKDPPGTLYCSFCGKSQYEVIVMIAGPTVMICDECVDICIPIITEARSRIDFAHYWNVKLQVELEKGFPYVPS